MNREQTLQALDNGITLFRKSGREDIATVINLLRFAVDIEAELEFLTLFGDQWKRITELRMAEARRELDIEEIKTQARKELLDELIEKLRSAGVPSDVEKWPELLDLE